MALNSGKRARPRTEALPGYLGRLRSSGEPFALAPLRGMDLDGLLADAIDLHAEVLALRDLFEDAEFLAWALQRALTGHPDLRLLARHVSEQLKWDGHR